MKYSEQPLQTFRLRNFKAVRDSGNVKFTPLTVFIGNNGSGKSSLIEGLETFQAIVTDGLDEAMNKWRGFEFIWNPVNALDALERNANKRGGKKAISEIYLENPLKFELRERGGLEMMEIASEPGMNDVRIRREMAIQRVGGGDEFFSEEVRSRLDPKKIYSHSLERDKQGIIWDLMPQQDKKIHDRIEENDSMFDAIWGSQCFQWQFLNLNPQVMSQPRPTRKVRYPYLMESSGSNIGDYLSDILRQDQTIFESIIETLRYVLPYAKDVQSALTSELGRQRFIQLSEQNFKVPGWLLSTGTLRVLALLAVLRHPNPPPLLCIEEIENGLDPRTLNLIVEEIARATQSGRTQVVCTTHSPYFLDLVPLSSIVVVERDDSGQPTFTRPDEKALGEWATKFAPGQLYTMSQLTRS